ncbi:MAG: VOC family protein [Rubrivivax sp.]|nr:VOC family protein [Rubrivivax sp.]
MSFVAVDHLVVAAATLDEGAAWCERTLGVAPDAGGRHALFGTHNRVLAIGSASHPQAYLEIIAIDPEAPAPARPRWFGLDAIDLGGGPRLIHWVGRSPMLDMHRWGLINVGEAPGDPVAASRPTPAGLLQWQILVRADGRLGHGGALPTLIQWEGAHPTEAMPARGLALQALVVNHLPRRVREVLRLRGVECVDDAGPALRARLRTPLGNITLESKP